MVSVSPCYNLRTIFMHSSAVLSVSGVHKLYVWLFEQNFRKFKNKPVSRSITLLTCTAANCAIMWLFSACSDKFQVVRTENERKECITIEHDEEKKKMSGRNQDVDASLCALNEPGTIAC